jgi:hypothetical protein
MESLLLINDPKLNGGTKHTLELPKWRFQALILKELHGLFCDTWKDICIITILLKLLLTKVVSKNKRSFNDQDRYNRLRELNLVELLRSTLVWSDV